MRNLTATFILLICLFLHPAPAPGSAGGTAPLSGGLMARGEAIAGELSKITGCAISPLLGISVLGAYTYSTTPEAERDSLPWHAAPRFWGPLLVVLCGIILKDSAKVAIPKILLVPLDAAETLLEKNASAVLALLVLLSSTAGSGSGQGTFAGLAAGLSFPPAAHAATGPGGHALAAASGLLQPATVYLLIIAVFVVVWVVSQAFNFLIFLSPFSSIDLLLTLWKNSVVALLLGAWLVHPYAGLLFSLAVILLCAFLFSRSLRFVVFGSMTAMDMLRRKKEDFGPGSGAIRAFAGVGLAEVPPMSYGVLSNVDGTLRFAYRPWLLLPYRVREEQTPPGTCFVGKGILSPLIVREAKKAGQYATLYRLRPRYAGREELIAQMLGLGGVRDLTMGRSVREGLLRLRQRLRPSGSSGTLPDERSP